MASHRILLGGKQMRYILKNEQNVAGGGMKLPILVKTYHPMSQKL